MHSLDYLKMFRRSEEMSAVREKGLSVHCKQREVGSSNAKESPNFLLQKTYNFF